jgi:lysophospholipase L1-like esterase
MKTILCYGDSNTWGWNPATMDRFGRDERWPGVLRNELGAEHLVIEEGLSGRTTVWDDPIEGFKNGAAYLPPCLETHKPLDLVVIMLGSNDLKMRFSLSAYDIAAGVGALVDIVQKSGAGPEGAAPQALVIVPPPLGELSDFADMFTGGVEKSRQLAIHYQKVAEQFNCALLDAGSIVTSSDIDGVHLELAEHQKLGKAVAARVRALLE